MLYMLSTLFLAYCVKNLMFSTSVKVQCFCKEVENFFIVHVQFLT